MNRERTIKLSIITVTYNAARQLERTIHSVEAQTYANVEHIIVDGNSKDETLQLIHAYQERNGMLTERRREINILSEPDAGLYDAMNKAIGMATGNYILFLNAGDKFHSEATLNDVAMKALDTHVGVLYGNTCIVDDEGNFLHERRLSPPEELNWKSFKQGMLVCHQAFFVRRDLAVQNLYNLKYRFSADFDWCIRIMHQAERMNLALVNTHIVIADYLDGGLTQKNHRKSLWERFRIMAHHYGVLTTVFLHVFFLARAVYKK